MAQLVDHPRILVTLWKPFRKEEEILPLISQYATDTTISPKNRYIALPLHYLKSFSKEFGDKGLVFGSDFMDPVTESSFTAPIAARLLKEAGAQFVLIGTQEHRSKHDETNASINAKINRAIEEDLIPFLCVGDTVEEFTAGRTKEVVLQQLKECLAGIKTLNGFIIIYEAPWMDKFPYKPNESDLAKAYKDFEEAVNEFFSAKVLPTLHLIFAYPYDLDHVPEYLKKTSAAGYYFEKPIYYSNLKNYELHSDLMEGLQTARDAIAIPDLAISKKKKAEAAIVEKEEAHKEEIKEELEEKTEVLDQVLDKEEPLVPQTEELSYEPEKRDLEGVEEIDRVEDSGLAETEDAGEAKHKKKKEKKEKVPKKDSKAALSQEAVQQDPPPEKKPAKTEFTVRDYSALSSPEVQDELHKRELGKRQENHEK